MTVNTDTTPIATFVSIDIAKPISIGHLHAAELGLPTVDAALDNAVPPG